MTQEIEIWLKELLRKNNKSVYESLINENIDILNTNFFENGLVDSFGVMSVIEEIEKKYSITLNEKHFEQRRFSTISGLKDIISEEIS